MLVSIGQHRRPCKHSNTRNRETCSEAGFTVADFSFRVIRSIAWFRANPTSTSTFRFLIDDSPKTVGKTNLLKGENHKSSHFQMSHSLTKRYVYGLCGGAAVAIKQLNRLLWRMATKLIEYENKNNICVRLKWTVTLADHTDASSNLYKLIRSCGGSAGALLQMWDLLTFELEKMTTKIKDYNV